MSNKNSNCVKKINYDNLNRIKSAFSLEGSDLSNLGISYYDVDNISYDKNGNIKTLKRHGSLSGESLSLWDDLTYTYNGGNQLEKVSDLNGTNDGFKDGYTGTDDDFKYDENGNMTSDKNKDITKIIYNHLNLPESITFNNNSLPNIDYIYDATGVKLKKIIIDGGVTTTTYAGSFIYNDNGVDGETLQFISQPEGYIVPTVVAGEGSSKSVKGFDTSTGQTTYSDYAYVFQYKDHLGNVRLSYSDSDLDGAINFKEEIIEESNYYPFGLKQKGYNYVVDGGNDLAQAFKYNGVELNESLGLNLYEMDLRLYDPAIGRFNGIDPVVHHSMGTSITFDNNPVFWADPSGADAYSAAVQASGGASGKIEGREGSLSPGDNSSKNSGWSYTNGGSYRNNDTGEVTNNWRKAIDETASKTIHLYADMISFLFKAAAYDAEEAIIDKQDYKVTDGSIPTKYLDVKNTINPSRSHKLSFTYADPNKSYTQEGEAKNKNFGGSITRGDDEYFVYYVGAGDYFQSFLPKYGPMSYSSSESKFKIEFYQDKSSHRLNATIMFKNQAQRDSFINTFYRSAFNFYKELYDKVYSKDTVYPDLKKIEKN